MNYESDKDVLQKLLHILAMCRVIGSGNIAKVSDGTLSVIYN